MKESSQIETILVTVRSGTNKEYVRTYSISKQLLMRNSHYFKAILQGSNDETEVTLPISDETMAFPLLISFMNTKKLDWTKDQKLHVASLALALKMPELLNICRNMLKTESTKDLVRYYILANSTKTTSSLLPYIVAELAGRLHNLTNWAYFKVLPWKLMLEVLKNNSVHIKEFDSVELFVTGYLRNREKTYNEKIPKKLLEEAKNLSYHLNLLHKFMKTLSNQSEFFTEPPAKIMKETHAQFYMRLRDTEDLSEFKFKFNDRKTNPDDQSMQSRFIRKESLHSAPKVKLDQVRRSSFGSPASNALKKFQTNKTSSEVELQKKSSESWLKAEQEKGTDNEISIKALTPELGKKPTSFVNLPNSPLLSKPASFRKARVILKQDSKDNT